jgi:hypothetical protein
MGATGDPTEAVPSMIRRAGFWLIRAPFLSKDETLLESGEEGSVTSVSVEVFEAVEYVEDAEETGSEMDNDELLILRGMVIGELKGVLSWT